MRFTPAIPRARACRTVPSFGETVIGVPVTVSVIGIIGHALGTKQHYVRFAQIQIARRIDAAHVVARRPVMPAPRILELAVSERPPRAGRYSISRIQMFWKLMGAEGSPCACNLIAARSYGR
jgi:hypothetical protein